MAAFVAKLPTLDTLPYWNELQWIQQAHRLSAGTLERAVPGLHRPGLLSGHPPALFVTVAAIWKVAGYSVSSAHLLIAAFAAVGVVSIFLLGRLLRHGPRSRETWRRVLRYSAPPCEARR
jgi:hypothetical protein